MTTNENLPHSVLRRGSGPLSTPVQLQSCRTRASTVGLGSTNKAPLPPGPPSVYRIGANNNLRVTKFDSASVANAADSNGSDDVSDLQVITEEQNVSLLRHSDLPSSKSDDDFYWLEDSGVFKDDDNSKALEMCRKSILKPYYVVLRLIGWRQLLLYDEINDYCIKRAVNNVFAVFMVLVIIIGFVFQEITCFSRASVFNEEVETANSTSFAFLRCDGGYVRDVAIVNALILASYIFGYYIFRYSQREHLSNLTEKVFLGYTDKYGQFSQKKLIRYLKILALIGIAWFVLSIPLNILRVYSLKLFSKDTYYYYLKPHSKEELIEIYNNQSIEPPLESEAKRYIYVTLSVIGFTANDLFYIAAVINYSLQCQLITFLINVTVGRIRNDCWKVDKAIKEIKVTKDFLKVLNGQVASQMSLLLYVLIQTIVSAIINWLETDSEDLVALITGLLNTLSWSFLALFIVAQATLVTVTCQKIRKLGMELRSRPFTYSEISQLDLDSFLLYTTSITLDARLVHIPMKPAYVLPILFAIATVCSVSSVPF